MTGDNKPTVLLKERGCTLFVLESGSTSTPIFDFKLDDEAYAMGVIAERLYLDFFGTPKIKFLVAMLDFLKEDYGNFEVEVNIVE